MLGTDMLVLWWRWRSGVGFDCAWWERCEVPNKKTACGLSWLEIKDDD